MLGSQRFFITEQSQIGTVRREGMRLGSALSNDETLSGHVGIVITELATNLIKHGGGGQILLRGSPNYIEILSVDKGKGSGNLEESLRDGFSTAGSPGTGLGAVKRLSQVFDIYSESDQGMIVLSRIFKRPSEDEASIEYGAICIPHPRETTHGDNWSYGVDSNSAYFLIADGLGHGPLAQEASEHAVQVFEKRKTSSLSDLVNQMHLALRSTRGVAATVVKLDLTTQALEVCGVGNVAASIESPTHNRKAVVANGTVGHQIRKIQSFTYPVENESVCVIHSDGIGTSWDLKKYRGIFAKHSSIIAALLLRDFARGTDDATVVVFRKPGTP